MINRSCIEMKKVQRDKRDILDISIGKSLKYKMAAFAGALMHVTFFVIFVVIKLYTMVIFNIFSVALYTLMGALCERDNFEDHPLLWINLMYFEIVIHAVLCTIFLGAETCFFLYSMMTIPVAIYYLFLTCSNTVFKRGTVVYTLLTIMLLTAALLFAHFNEPLFFTHRYELSTGAIDLIRAINILFTTLLMFAFSCLFILEIHSLIKKLNLTNEQLNFTATHDSLTGLYNRNCLRGTLDELEHSDEPFCLVMGDLDDFKKVNDTYGHDCGDVVLRSVAEIIMNNIGENDIACRWGGEEMLIIMHGSYDECFGRVSNIKALINSLAIDHENSTVKVSMTFGFAASGEDGSISSAGIDAMLSTVDKRLYKGKASGKNVIIA